MKEGRQGVRYRAGKDWHAEGQGAWDSLTLGGSAIDYSNREIERLALAFLYSEKKVSIKITRQLEALSEEELRTLDRKTSRLLTDSKSFKSAEVDRALKALSRVVEVSLPTEGHETPRKRPASSSKAPVQKPSMGPRNNRPAVVPTSKQRPTPSPAPQIKDAAFSPLQASPLTLLVAPSVAPGALKESSQEPVKTRERSTISKALNSYREPRYRELPFEDLCAQSQALSVTPRDLCAIVAEAASRFSATKVMLEGLAATLVMNSAAAGDVRSLELFDLVKELYDWETNRQA